MLKVLLTRSLAVLMLLAGFQSAFAQGFWFEGFGNQASSTTNWVHGGTNAGTIQWGWTNLVAAGAYSPGDFTAPTAGNGYFWFDSDANGENAHDVTLTGVGVPADATGKNDVHVRFYTYFRTFSGTDVAQVGISTDGTNFTYHNLPELDALIAEAPGATQIFQGYLDVDVPEADNQSTVWVQFRYTGNFEYYWKVDDIQLYDGTPSATPVDVTFKVNMALENVDPAGVFIAGSFNGWSDEAMTDEGGGLWSITKSLPAGEMQMYKFKNGPGGWESGNAACGVSDGFGGYNRTITPAGITTLAAVCFNACDPCVVTCDQNPNSIICDNFDSYNAAQKLGPQATHWTTWSGTEGGNEDGIVSTEQANTAPNSLKLLAGAAGGGPQDVVLNLGNKTNGRYDLTWKMYVPTGKEAYYNIQNVVPIGAGSWNLDVFFSPNGAGNIQIGAGASLAEFTYPYGQWFTVKHEIDLDNNLLTLWINGAFVKKMAYPNNLGGIDFYCINGNGQYYVDDLEYIQLPSVVYNVDNCDNALDITSLFGQASGVISTSATQNNSTATLSPTDPTEGYECHFGGDPLQGSSWFTFTGDGNTYRVFTSDCGTSPIPDGDSQFALYSGDCGDLTALDCNDDVSGSDLHSQLFITTEPGVNYFLLVDGFDGATGDYCINVEQTASILCADGVVGQHELANDGIVCWGGSLADIMIPDPATWVIPNQGPVFGNIWCVTTDDIGANPTDWPGDNPGIVSTTANPNVVLVGLPNDGSLAFAQPGLYYLTPVVVGGATIIDPAGGANIFNIDVTNGCFYVGQSQQFFFVPELSPLVAFASVSPGTPAGTISIDLTIDGGLGAAVGDPSLYNFLWSNGATTPSLNNVPDVPYTVTISDPTGCVEEVVVDVVGTTDPSTVKSFKVSPNPTTGVLNMTLALTESADVRVEVINTLGQVMQTINAGETAQVNQTIDMSRLANGIYSVRVYMGDIVAVRRVVVQR